MGHDFNQQRHAHRWPAQAGVFAVVPSADSHARCPLQAWLPKVLAYFNEGNILGFKSAWTEHSLEKASTCFRALALALQPDFLKTVASRPVLYHA